MTNLLYMNNKDKIPTEKKSENTKLVAKSAKNLTQEKQNGTQKPD